MRNRHPRLIENVGADRLRIFGRELLGINEPDFGFLTDTIQVRNDSVVTVSEHMMTPMIEAEIAFVLKSSLPAENVTLKQVLEATDYVTACFEFVDTRFETQKIKIVDTIADNASSALFVLGDERMTRRLSICRISNVR